MTDTDDITGAVDGRMARRQRNIDAVLDVVLEMFSEEAMFPTIEQAATRSGLSLRSLYRYFADPGELLEAAIKRSDQIGAGLSKLHAIGQGPLDGRIADYVTMRLKLHDGIGPMYRATLVNAARHPRIWDELATNEHVERLGEPLDAVEDVLAMPQRPVVDPGREVCEYHYVNIHDATYMGITGQLPIWNDDWQDRVQVAIPAHGKDRPVSEMANQRIGNYDALKDYQRAVFDRTEHHLAAMDPADFDRVIIAPPYPPQVADTYSARCAGPQGITVLDAFECWHYQHGLRHMGEIELAVGFLGLGGMTA